MSIPFAFLPPLLVVWRAFLPLVFSENEGFSSLLVGNLERIPASCCWQFGALSCPLIVVIGGDFLPPAFDS